VKLVLSFLVLSAGAACAATISAPGVPNFHRVNDHIYRGGQPGSEGWTSLADLGIKVVLDLRPPSEHSTTGEEQAVEAAGMHYVNVPMKGIGAPTGEEVSRALEILDADSSGAVFVHCRRGSDRTGTVIACYRITHDHWNNQKALKEAQSYGLNFLERGMKHYIMNFNPAAEPVAAVSGGH
jgi:tyrosine-protein phosphatase SIW14